MLRACFIRHFLLERTKLTIYTPISSSQGHFQEEVVEKFWDRTQRASDITSCILNRTSFLWKKTVVLGVVDMFALCLCIAACMCILTVVLSFELGVFGLLLHFKGNVAVYKG